MNDCNTLAALILSGAGEELYEIEPQQPTAALPPQNAVQPALSEAA